MINSYFYALLQIGWDEGSFFSVASQALPTALVVLAAEGTSSPVISLLCFFMVMVQLWRSLRVLGPFQLAFCFLPKGSHSKDIKRDKRRVFHYVDQRESFQVTQK